jgi:RNA polymerase sigma factor (sigma-70 family)
MPDYLKFSDTDLIEKCLEKDADAWESLVRRYQRLIASITIKFGLSAEDSADVFQSVCLILLQKLTTLRKQAKLSSWLITVTVRECGRLRERGSRAVSLDEPEWEHAAQTPDQVQQLIEDQLLTIEQQHIIRCAVEALPLQCRQLIEYLFYSDPQLTYVEISSRLNIPVASIGPVRGRCLVKLKESLKKSGFF